MGAIANETRTDITALVNLYARGTLAAKDLGASQEQLYTFVTRVGQAVKVSGSSTAEAAGGLRQLSQALGSGTVRAEEFNSIMEGIPAAAQAAARGIDAAGGSVSKLRNLVISGEVSSKEFFEGFLRGSKQTAEAFEKTKSTVADSFTVLNNNLTLFVGKLNEATGATEKVSSGIAFLANNLDKMVPVAGALVAVLGARGLVGALRLARTAALALNVAIRANPIGLVVSLATTAAAAYWGWNEATKATTKSLEEQRRAINRWGDAADDARKKAAALWDAQRLGGLPAGGGLPREVSFSAGGRGTSSSPYGPAGVWGPNGLTPPPPSQSIAGNGPAAASFGAVIGLMVPYAMELRSASRSLGRFGRSAGRAWEALDGLAKAAPDILEKFGAAPGRFNGPGGIFQSAAGVARGQALRGRGYLRSAEQVAADEAFERGAVRDRFADSSANSVIDGFDAALAAAAAGQDKWKDSAEFVVRGIQSAITQAAAEPFRKALKDLFSQLFQSITGSAGTAAASQVSQNSRQSLAV